MVNFQKVFWEDVNFLRILKSHKNISKILKFTKFWGKNLVFQKLFANSGGTFLYDHNTLWLHYTCTKQYSAAVCYFYTFCTFCIRVYLVNVRNSKFAGIAYPNGRTVRRSKRFGTRNGCFNLIQWNVSHWYHQIPTKRGYLICK